eukprot:1835587-Pyramimonas_sp.AAC.1
MCIRDRWRENLGAANANHLLRPRLCAQRDKRGIVGARSVVMNPSRLTHHGSHAVTGQPIVDE